MSRALTDNSYWNKHWQEHARPALSTSGGYAERVWFRIYEKAFQGAQLGDSCLEVGCGNSEHLVRLGRRYGVQVYGLDYSTEGCELSRQRLQQAGISGQVYQRDMFGPNEDLQGKFDYVVSFGLVEHFEDTGEPLRAMRRFLKDGGTILTTTPNFTPHSINVWVYRIVGPKTLATHKLMSADQLRLYHEQAGFHTIATGYEGMGLWFVCDRPTALRKALRTTAFRAVQGVRKGFEVLRLCPPRNSFTGLVMVYIGRA